MIVINDAWDVLGDPVRRAAYDATRAGTAASQLQAGPGQGATRTTYSSAYASAAPGGGTAGSASTTPDATHAGPPPGRPSGTVLDFGRYSGWSLGEIARHDPDYLEWLLRATFGRRLRTEVEALLRQRSTAAERATANQRWGGRR